MDKEKQDDGRLICPVGRFFMDLGKMTGEKSAFYTHMNRSCLEFLKAVKSLVDAKIEGIEKETAPQEPQKATKIEVE